MESLDALVDTALRETLLCVRRRPAPVTADDVAAELGVHRSVARGRLERLLRAGLLEARFARRSGRTGPGAGRPAKLYASAPARGVLEFPPRRVATIVSGLLDEIAVSRRKVVLGRVGHRYGGDVAAAAGVKPVADSRRGLEGVCDALRSLGFPASLERMDAGGGVIATPDCPLRALVREHPDAAALDRGMWTALVEHGVRGVRAADVQCSTDGCQSDGPCTVTVAFGERN